MTIPAFTPQGRTPAGEPTWNPADLEAYEHLLETQGTALKAARAANAARRIVFGHRGDGTNVQTGVGTRDDLARRANAAAADSPALHLLNGGTPRRGKTSGAAAATATTAV